MVKEVHESLLAHSCCICVTCVLVVFCVLTLKKILFTIEVRKSSISDSSANNLSRIVVVSL